MSGVLFTGSSGTKKMFYLDYIEDLLTILPFEKTVSSFFQKFSKEIF